MRQFEQERNERQARPDEETEVEIVSSHDAPSEEEETPSCEERVALMESTHRDVRLRAYEEMIDSELDLEDCPDAVDALRRVLRQETDDFLVFRGIEALWGVIEDDVPTFLPFLDHRSGDVRRKAAQLLGGEVFEPEDAARVADAILREEDPWDQVSLAGLWPGAHEGEISTMLLEMIEEGGPAAAAAMKTLREGTDSVAPLVAALSQEGPLRGSALLLLGRHTESEAVRNAMLEVVRRGSAEERVHVAMYLLGTPGSVDTSVWTSVVLDSSIPLQWRAGLLLSASYWEEWIPVACQAKRADAELEAFVDGLLGGDVERLREVMDPPALDALEFGPPDGGTVHSSDGASVRCSTRPFGPPAPGQERIPAGATVYAPERFTVDGIEWRMAVNDPPCWVQADRIDPSGAPVEEAARGAEVLEVDVPVDLLPSLATALAAGDLELFDPMPGFTGIRVARPTEDMLDTWYDGETERLAILAAIEARAAAAALAGRGAPSAQNR